MARLSLEKVLKTIPSGLFVVDREHRILCWNAEAERITGYRAEEVLGLECSFLRGIPCGSRCGLYDDSVPKPIIGVPCSIRSKSGKRLILSKNVDYLRDEGGRIVGGIESFVDITHRCRLEERLRRHSRQLEEKITRRTAELEKERTRLGTVLDAMSDPVFIAGPDYRILFINRAMTEIFGDVLGRSCHEVFHGFAEPCPWCPMSRVLAGETVADERTFEINHRCYEIIHTPLRSAEGETEKLAVHRDITDRKKAEAKLREANRELDAFVYTVSHDLRSPLTPIIGFAEFLREEYRDDLDAQGLELLGEIEGQGQKLLALLEDLLTLSRVGRIEPPEEPVDTNEVVRAALDRYSQKINGLNLEVTVEPLPAVHLPTTLLGDLFANLIANAVRYGCPPGGRLEIGSREAGDQLLLFVRDHGRGIPKEERQRIFDAFYRGSTSSETRGTGIGLATVRKIARLYNGRTWADDTPGGGATFWVEFPLSKS